jgi:hypothetical protein
MSYRTANLQTLHFKYFFNKYPYWPFLAQIRPSLTEISHVAGRGVPLVMTGGTKGSAQRARTLQV